MNPAIKRELLDTKLPLWRWNPDIPRYSIGWRMGEGDTYSWEFSKWWESLSPAAQQAYQRLYPEPVGWRGWYAEEDWDEDEGAGEDEKADSYDLDGV